MLKEFDTSQFSQWCGLYVRLIGRNRQKLAQCLANHPHGQLQDALLADLSSPVPSGELDEQALLHVYGQLRQLEKAYLARPLHRLQTGLPEARYEGTRYLLCRSSDGALFHGIHEERRVKLNAAIGVDGDIQLSCHWQAVEENDHFECQHSTAFDPLALNRQHLRVGLSPVANSDEMHWTCDAHDGRGMNGEIPFWCAGADDEAGLQARVIEVLQTAYASQVDLLIFPELVMTPGLETAIADWLGQHNLFQPVMRLVVAGSRHVWHPTSQPNDFSNRCTVLNHAGEVEWQQDKRQPFRLEAAAAQALFGQACPGAREPTRLADTFVLRQTVLGMMATPICLDFIHDHTWHKLPVHLYLVPAMSASLSRFEHRCRDIGQKAAAAFVCNAHAEQTHYAYVPSKDPLQVNQISPHLFTVDVQIKVN
jgi:hypothetical protein